MNIINTHIPSKLNPWTDEMSVLSMQLDSKNSYPVPSEAQAIHVLTGAAWVAYRGKNHIIETYDMLPLDPVDAHTARVTALCAFDTSVAIVLSE